MWHRPKLDGAVLARGSERGTVRRKGEAEDNVLMPLQDQFFLPISGVPQANAAATGAGSLGTNAEGHGQEAPVGRKSERAVRGGQRIANLTGGRIPKINRFAVDPAGQQLPIRRVGNRPDGG